MAHLLLIDDDPALIPKQVGGVPGPPASGRGGPHRHGRGRARPADPPDVILLDLRLPDQSGLEVYQAIRQIDARIPVIFITVARSADAAIEAMQQGAYDYLFKPLDLQQLQQVVGEAWKWPGGCASRPWSRRPARTPTWRAPSSAAARPCARCTRPSAGSPARTCPC